MRDDRTVKRTVASTETIGPAMAALLEAGSKNDEASRRAAWRALLHAIWDFAHKLKANEVDDFLRSVATSLQKNDLGEGKDVWSKEELVELFGMLADKYREDEQLRAPGVGEA